VTIDVFNHIVTPRYRDARLRVAPRLAAQERVVPALRCGLEFFGVDRVMFATDMPFDTRGGRTLVEVALQAMQALDAPAGDKAQIFEGNARRVFRLAHG